MKNVPKLRFSGFSDEWAEKKIGELYDDLKAGSTPSKLKSEYFKGNVPWITSGELKSKYIYSTLEYITEEAKQSANLKLYDEGTLFIAITGLEAPGTRGSCAINKVKATTNQSCMAFQKSNLVNNEFTYYWYNLYGEYIGITYTQGTKQQSLNNKLVADLKISIPSIEEQEKIANFLTKVDKLIEKQDEKVNNLEQYKKGMMQKIFSQEIRFKKDDGGEYPEWDKGKASELFKNISDKNHNGDLEVLSVTQDRGVILRSDLDIDIKFDLESVKNYKRVKPGDFIISLRSFQGGFELTNIEGLISPAYTVFNFLDKDKFNAKYFGYIFKSENFIRKLSGLIYGVRDGKAISFTDFSTMKFEYPCVEEQTKIANFLSKIDLIVEKEKEKLEELREWKKGLLQQMFV